MFNQPDNLTPDEFVDRTFGEKCKGRENKIHFANVMIQAGLGRKEEPCLHGSFTSSPDGTGITCLSCSCPKCRPRCLHPS